MSAWLPHAGNSSSSDMDSPRLPASQTPFAWTERHAGISQLAICQESHVSCEHVSPGKGVLPNPKILLIGIEKQALNADRAIEELATEYLSKRPHRSEPLNQRAAADKNGPALGCVGYRRSH